MLSHHSSEVEDVKPEVERDGRGEPLFHLLELEDLKPSIVEKSFRKGVPPYDRISIPREGQ